MSATPSDMARLWRQRAAETCARARLRAQRLMARMPQARDLLLRSWAKRAWLFGSLPTDEDREGCDVDLPVEERPASAFFDVLWCTKACEQTAECPAWQETGHCAGPKQSMCAAGACVPIHCK